MAANEPFYDSDEGIGWGPMTLRERKARVQIPARITTRHSDIYSDKLMYLNTKMPTSETQSPASMSSGSSNYMTPDVTFADDQSEAFLGKLEKVLATPSGSSIYLSANSTNTSEMVEKYYTEVVVAPVRDTDTLLNIIEANDCHLDSIQPTLVENTIILSDDSGDDSVGDVLTIDDSESSNVSAPIKGDSFNVSGCERLDSDDSVSIHVPDIDIAQFDESVQFNDTLEEMHNLLANDVSKDSQFSDSDAHKSLATDESKDSQFSDASTIESDDEHTRSPSFISGSFFNKYETEKPKPMRLQLAAPRVQPLYDNIRSPVGDYIKKSPTFKQPAAPRLLKHPTPTKPLNFKNVVSPIGLYIKNSPMVCFKKNVGLKSSSCGAVTPKKQTDAIREGNKENLDDSMPLVYYQPAKHKEENTKHKLIDLPASIKSLMIEPIIVKHEGRIQKTEKSGAVVEKKLLATVTNNPSDCTCLMNDTNEDVSILMSKQAFKK